MNFFDTTHCKSRAHCKRCRDREGGQKWRAGVLVAFGGSNDNNFACPENKAWIKNPKKGPRKNPFYILWEEITEDIPDAWLNKMANQCREMYENPPKGMICKDKKAWRKRWLDKLNFYKHEYQNNKRH